MGACVRIFNYSCRRTGMRINLDLLSKTFLNLGRQCYVINTPSLASRSARQKGLPYEWCRPPDVGLPAPDLVVFLDITPEKARQRGEYGNERYEKEEMQRRVREQYKRIESENIVQWATIDAGREREQVAVDIWDAR